jgi:hypothetical protein
MQNVKSFINLLGKNYYADFLIEIDSETIDFQKYEALVKYQDNFYFELSNSEIIKKQKNSFDELKKSYQEALTEIYSATMSYDTNKVNTFIDFNTKAVLMHVNTLKKDFYIDDIHSRFYSILEDNPNLINLENSYYKNLKNDEQVLNSDIFNLVVQSKSTNFRSVYFLDYLYERNKILSFIPFKLFQLAQRFIYELNKIKISNNPDKTKQKVMSVNNQNSLFNTTILEAFLVEINNINDLYKYTFIQCYDFGIKRFTDSLITEIKENILLLPQEKIKIYLEYVKDKIESSPNFSEKEISLDKWIVKYNIEDLNFPYLENDEVNNLITKSITYYLWDEKDRSLMESIQLDFFYYAIRIESNKVIDYLNNITSTKIEKKGNTKQPNNSDTIFKSDEVFERFNDLVQYLKIDLEDISKRGNQAKFSGIWSCPDSKKEFFKDHTELNEYLKFLNINYLTTYKSRNLSDGSKFHITIKNWLKEKQ